MDSKFGLSKFLLFFASTFVSILTCSPPSQPPEKPRLASIADMSIFVNDTARLCAEPVFAPATIKGFLWSFDGGKTYTETTAVACIDRSWGLADTGTHALAVKIFDTKKSISDSVAFRVSVIVCRPDLAIIADTVADVKDPSNLHITNNSECRHILKYIWSFDAGASFTDTTLDSSIMKQWSVRDTGRTVVVASRALIVPGLVSEPAFAAIRIGYCRPDIVLTGDSIGAVNDSTRFFVLNRGTCSATCYLWSFNNGGFFTDSTYAPSILKRWTLSDTNIRAVIASVKTAEGIVSRPDTLHFRIGYCRPAIRLSGETLFHAGDTTRFSIENISRCPVAFYLWSFNNGLSFTDTTYSPSMLKRWEARDTVISRVLAAAATSEGMLSPIDTLGVSAVSCAPLIRLNGDSSAFVGDSTLFHANAIPTCSPIAWYLWSFDRGALVDTLRAPDFIKYWDLADTGRRVVYAKTQTVGGEVSSPDSCRIVVLAGLPKVSLPRDTTIFANDTVVIIARIDSSHRPIAYCVWTIDRSSREIMTDGNVLACSWPPGKAGIHGVSVRAVDRKGLSSARDSMTITVVVAYPTLVVPKDSLLRRKDTLTATVSASVAGGRIVQYLWNVGSLDWTDSSPAPQLKIMYKGKDSLSIQVGARDNRGVMKTDSFHVYFNAPPANLRMLSPRLNDTVIFHSIDSSFKRGAVTFRFSANDKNGNIDTLTYKLYLGKTAGSPPTVYEGRDTMWTSSAPLDTSVFYWTLVVKDRLGDSAQTSGSFTCLLQKTMCFAGHSIVVGFGGDGTNGGFRNQVLSTMRTRRGGTAKVKPTGPLTTGFMANTPDDSCFAVASYRARDLWLLMKNSFPTLNADLWVLMIGVNDGYSYNNEFRYLMWIIDTINVHNPQACTYVINGLPYRGSFGMDKVFNGWLIDSITARKNTNPSRNLWNIDAYKVFALNDTANPAFFAPELPYLLHPNQRGYDTLARMILDTMKLKFP